MTKELTRRDFLRRSGAAAAGAGLAAGVGPMVSTRSAAAGVASPDERLGIGLIGCGGRGQRMMRMALRTRQADCVAVCDVQQEDMDEAATFVRKRSGKAPQAIGDFRKLLELKEVDAVIIATPDHWHAIQTIMACQAGKDVYIEKPISHNIAEGLAMVKAVRDNKRIVQVGLMQRSGKDFQDAINYVHSGKLGKIGLVRAWFIKKRENMGHPPDGEPPPGLNWDLWLGPAPKRPFNPARFKVKEAATGTMYGSWRWFWDYAGGQLCDWGPHMVDVVRWGLKAGMPLSATAAGGNFVIDDCRECPDTLQVLYEFPGTTVVWEHRQWSDRSIEPGRYHGVEFYGDKGSLFVDRTGWEVFPEEGGEKAGNPGEVGKEKNMDEEHIADFIEAVKARKDPVMPIEQGFMTTATCQLGNIAFRSGHKVLWDDEKKTIPNDPEAMKYFSRTYRDPYKLPV